MSDYVADFVELNVQAGGFKKFFQVFGARGFFEFRGGDFGEVNLLVGDPCQIVGEPLRRSRDAWIARERRDIYFGGAQGHRGHGQENTGSEENFHRWIVLKSPGR